MASVSALDSVEPFDVCIIGSGFGGSVLGKCLVERGVRTLILESGGSLLRWLCDRRVWELAIYQTSGDTYYPSSRTRARALGGTSNFWTGRCERFHPSDFKDNPYTPSLNPWPISYEDMEPYYEKAEETLRVRGGVLSEHSPPRKHRLPLPPRTDISSLKSLLAEAGVTVDDSPTASPSKSLRFFRVQNEILPGFTASSHATLVTGATVARLIADAGRRIVGAEVRALDGTMKIARARSYVLACGGIETPRLLLLSQSGIFPRGIGNAYDRVGRCFTEHAGVNFYGKIRHRKGTMYPRHKVGRSHQFYDSFRAEGLGSVLPVFIQSWVFPHHLIRTKITDLPRDFVAWLTRIVRPTLYIGATIEMEPCDTNRVTLAQRKKDRFGNPLANLHFDFTERDRKTLQRTRELILRIFNRLGAEDIREAELTWSRHHIGTCRMGDNPTTSVVDRNLRLHDCSNLYVCGSETFATGGAVPPVLTITALAHRVADHLCCELQNP